MKNQQQFPIYIIAFIVCIGIAILLFSGVLLKEDAAGQIIFGSIWIAVGLLWLGQYFIILKKKRDNIDNQ